MNLTAQEQAELAGEVELAIVKVFGADAPDGVQIGWAPSLLHGTCGSPNCGWMGRDVPTRQEAIEDAVQHWKLTHMGR